MQCQYQVNTALLEGNEYERTKALIKPILRGKDIKKYQANWAGLWVIGTFPALNLNIDDYPALKNYLAGFGKRLHQIGEKGTRKKTTNQWFETQDSISYWSDFYKPKIVWENINYEANFSYGKEGVFINAPSNLMTSNNHNIKFLLCQMNSKIFNWYFGQLSGIPLGNAFEWKKQYVEQIPIPELTEEEQKPFTDLVDMILQKKQNGQDTTTEEQAIDELVFALYGLSEEEIRFVEGVKAED